MRNHLCAIAALGVFSGVAAAGPDWVERGNAGGTLGEAQPVVGVGQLRTIQGTLSTEGPEPDLEDMYLIRITQPSEFSFDLFSADFDTQLWLFNVTRADEAFGLLANDDADGKTRTSLIDGPATDGTGARVLNPGVYALAISVGGRVPISLGGLIYRFDSRTEISGPDGAGGLNSHVGWQGDGVGGSYVIGVEGVTYVDVPAPGPLALAGVGLAAAWRRRRR
jgi:MYXO-CTERM domain-containing protein